MLIERGQLPSTQCGARFKAWLRPLLDTGMVREMRAGAGAAMRVIHPEPVQRFYEKAFPSMHADSDDGSRVNGIALYRSSKALQNDTPLVLTTRVLQGGAVRIGGAVVEDGTATARDGVYAVKLTTDGHTQLVGKWVLIENPAVFHAHVRVFGTEWSALLLNGRMPDRLIHWLTTHSADELQLLHAPDYDPVGLDEFDRLQRALGERVALHIPHTLEELFAHYSDHTLLTQEKQQAFLRKHGGSAHPSIARIAALIGKHNAGLEQEALLIGR